MSLVPGKLRILMCFRAEPDRSIYSGVIKEIVTSDGYCRNNLSVTLAALADDGLVRLSRVKARRLKIGGRPGPMVQLTAAGKKQLVEVNNLLWKIGMWRISDEGPQEEKYLEMDG